MSEQEDDRNDVSAARSYLESIVEYYALSQDIDDGAETVEVDGETVPEDEFQDFIQRNVLQVGIRDSGFWEPGGPPDPDEYMILLATGGPSVRVWGNIGVYGEPNSAEIQQQDWFTPWKTVYNTTDDEDEALLWYAQQFYWGDV